MTSTRAVGTDIGNTTDCELERSPDPDKLIGIAAGATPRRVKRLRNFTRAVARRLRIVPTGQPDCSAAISWVIPSR